MRIPLVWLAVAAGICYLLSDISYVGALAHTHGICHCTRVLCTFANKAEMRKTPKE